jgi:ACS family tartrate transporter-like MFS transporter
MRERKGFMLVSLACICIGLIGAAMMAAPVPKMAFVTLASFGIFTALPVFWTLPTTILSGTAAAAGVAWINSIGNLGGYIGPTIFGTLKDRTGNDFYAVLFLAALSAVGFVLVLWVGHDKRAELDSSPVAAG